MEGDFATSAASPEVATLPLAPPFDLDDTPVPLDEPIPILLIEDEQEQAEQEGAHSAKADAKTNEALARAASDALLHRPLTAAAAAHASALANVPSRKGTSHSEEQRSDRLSKISSSDSRVPSKGGQRRNRKSLILRVTPTNIAGAMSAFFDGGCVNSPTLEYARSTKAVGRDFQKHRVKSVDPFLYDIAVRILDQVKGTYGNTRAYLSALYGEEQAKPEQMREQVIQYIAALALKTRVKVVLAKSLLSVANIFKASPEDPFILYLQNAPLAKGMVLPVCDHEIGTHLLRMMNEERQCWHRNRHKYDLRNHLTTEEGLAALNSLLSLPILLLWSPALRYYATAKATELGFAELFHDLEKYLEDPQKRFRLCIRVKRGLIDTAQAGSFDLDQTYLNGAVQLLMHRHEIDFPLLYSGQLDLNDLPRAKRMARRDCLKLPSFLKSPKQVWTYRRFLDKVAEANHIPDPMAPLFRPPLFNGRDYATANGSTLFKLRKPSSTDHMAAYYQRVAPRLVASSTVSNLTDLTRIARAATSPPGAHHTYVMYRTTTPDTNATTTCSNNTGAAGVMAPLKLPKSATAAKHAAAASKPATTRPPKDAKHDKRKEVDTRIRRSNSTAAVMASPLNKSTTRRRHHDAMNQKRKEAAPEGETDNDKKEEEASAEDKAAERIVYGTAAEEPHKPDAEKPMDETPQQRQQQQQQEFTEQPTKDDSRAELAETQDRASPTDKVKSPRPPPPAAASPRHSPHLGRKKVNRGASGTHPHPHPPPRSPNQQPAKQFASRLTRRATTGSLNTKTTKVKRRKKADAPKRKRSSADNNVGVHKAKRVVRKRKGTADRRGRDGGEGEAEGEADDFVGVDEGEGEGEGESVCSAVYTGPDAASWQLPMDMPLPLAKTSAE
ncbi:unnamed protein product [Vitrella brassicaformis CCMP3155]|uniref:Uncharacterized protein n=3 Tax=Vitrella brassicaformis TaxID=1169539 RepID=A0A0G4FMG6_VITBC|nr:unnamed protein product [Vitrella brassicaformis CCMP3155]|eukprot:CEM15036.1 unnamed protein product [Vitrella brassicaformis CCMP3155]